jgi:hypothetical protein
MSMVHGYHLVWSAYGWWLPNDPRGSGSRAIRVEALHQFGDIHYGRKVVQPSSTELREFFAQSKDHLKFKPRIFTANEVQIIAQTFAKAIADKRWVCHACAIMPEHVHVLMGRRLDTAETMVETFQQQSRAALIDAGCFPPMHAVWTAGRRVIYKSSPPAMASCVEYIENNPREIGLPEQRWDYVTPYDSRLTPF